MIDNMPIVARPRVAHVRAGSHKLGGGAWASSPSHFPPSLLDDDNASTDDESDLPLLQQENPLTYFLSPPTPKEEEDEMEFDFDFDAGIQDSNSPKDLVRSISPSTLDGLKRYKPRKADSDCAVVDDEDEDDSADDNDDGEDYIRYNPLKSRPFDFDDTLDGPARPTSPLSRSASPLSHDMEALLSPAAFHVGSPRGRPARRFAPPRRPFGGRAASLPLQRRHSWREPSPDVWSIEEEPEKETMSEMGLSMAEIDDGQKKTMPIDIPAAKPKKRVRFVLPSQE